MPDTLDTLEELEKRTALIDGLHRGEGFAYLWLAQGDYKKTIWYENGNGSPEIPAIDGVNVYFGVHLAREIPRTNAQGELAPPEKVRSQLNVIASVGALFAEFDALDSDRDALLERVKGLVPPPSAIIASGGGFHCYWLLTEPYRIDTADELTYVDTLQKRWVKFVGSDPGAKDLARVLRMPGTLNYKYKPSPREVRFVEASFAMYAIEDLDMASKAAIVEAPEEPRGSSPAAREKDLSMAIKAIAMLSKERADSYETWVEVGMALTELGDDGLNLWDNWSQHSEKFEHGKCAQKWATFLPGHGLTLGSLFHWAELDSGKKIIRPGKKAAKPSAYLVALTNMGYKFALNSMNDIVYVNGSRLTDTMASVLMHQLREHGYKGENVARDAWTYDAYQHRFHPIKDYLTGLTWDGDCHIENLATYFVDADDMFCTLLRRWMLGAVTRILGPLVGQEHAMLGLDGPQGIGKSRFVRFMGSPLPSYFRASPINPEDKDYQSYLCGTWVWEVDEVDATTRRADRKALNAFLTREWIQVRKAYGRYDFEGPPCASFIGTFNNENGYLSDPTGSRRFFTCELKSIDWAYSKEIDINQVWAQAVALWRQGETHELTPAETADVQKINARYEVEDTLAYHIWKNYTVDRADLGAFTTLAEIISTLQNDGAVRGTEAGLTNRVAGILIRERIQKGQATINGHRLKVWKGIKRLSITETAKVQMEK